MIGKIYREVLKKLNPYNREISIRNRKTIVIRDHWFDDFFGNLLWPDKEKEIGIHGGLGDVLLLLPFLQQYKNKYPMRRLKVIYTDVRTDSVNPEKFGLGQTRLEKGAGGQEVNPIADFLENITFIDEKCGGDPTNAKEYWHPDEPFRKKWGRYPTPTEYSSGFFNKIFSKEDCKAAKQFYVDHKLHQKFVVAFHFRRGSDKILKISELIREDEAMRSDVKCLFLGSSRNEPLPDIDFSGQIDLTDNYSKGVSLRVLYQIVMNAQLFVGGRGSFEHFFWLAQVPSINLMDKEGYEGNHGQFGTWIPEFWSENKFKDCIFYEDAQPGEIVEKLIKPYFQEWQSTQE